MSEPPDSSAFAQFVTATAGRNMTKAAYVAVVAGVVLMVLLSIDPAYSALHGWLDALLFACLIFFIFEWVVRLRQAVRTQRVAAYLLSIRGFVDGAGAIAIPLALALGATPKTAWLLGVLWLLKVIPGIPRIAAVAPGAGAGIRAAIERAGDLPDGAVSGLGRGLFPGARRPAGTFGSIPAALWWAVATLTTTGYGDVVPITPLGRIVAAFVMICGLGVFGLWTGILATGFAAETRRDNFLKTWESVSKVPFFAALGPAAIADVTHMLRTMDLPARTTIIRKGQTGDCMYFIAAGEVEVDLPGKKVKLGDGAFFGEMALLGNNLRSANITTTRVSKLLVLDLVDFRVLMARHPDLSETIDAEAKRRELENK